jgi:SAM-dependent methyltransferase
MASNAAARHFNERAVGYRRFRERWPLGVLQAEEDRAVQRLAEVLPGQRVLEVGCGAGRTLAWLHQQGTRAFGVDVSHEMAHECADAGHAVSVQDMQWLAFRPVFDWVMCVGALEFAGDPLEALRGFAASLRAGGRMLLLYPRRGLLGSLYRMYHRSNGIEVRLFGIDDIHGLFHHAGFAAPYESVDCRLASVCVAQRVE